MAAAPPPPSPLPFFCNGCLCELKLFDDVPTTGGSRANKRYYTNCQHVLCQNCKMRSSHQCVVCKKPCRTIEINDKMNQSYRTYFEPSVKMRANLMGAVQFQANQREIVTARLIAQGKHLQGKYREAQQKLAEVEAERAEAKAEERKIAIIFKKISEEQARVKEMKRQKLAEAQHQQQQRARQFRQPQPDNRPAHRDTSNWFGDDDNQNHRQHQRHGRGHGFDPALGQSNYGHANHGWTGGFDATTTAQTNFGETPQTYRPFIDETPEGPSHQQSNFMDAFQAMNNRY